MPFPSPTTFPSADLYPAESPRVLTDRAIDMLEMLPPWMQDDPDIQAAHVAMTNELDRIDQHMADVVADFFPWIAGTYLYLWEAALGLAQNPTGLTLAQRQQRVLAFLFRRVKLARSSTWVQLLTQLLGPVWTWARHPDQGTPTNTITINLPYGAGSPQASDMTALLQLITPANIALVISYGQGFIVEQSQIQQQPL